MGKEIISWGKTSLFISDQPIAFDSCDLAVEEEEPDISQPPFSVSELKDYTAQLLGFDVGDLTGDRGVFRISIDGKVTAEFNSMEYREVVKRVPRKLKKLLKKQWGDSWKHYAPHKEYEVTLSNKKERP